jgi:hypothetical protein
MDDLTEKLAEVLNDPESMARVMEMAESLLGNSSSPQQQGENSGDISGDELKTIISLISRLKGSGDDTRTQLLRALKPHLSEPKQEKVDTAIKILKLIEMLPLIKETGILNL